jgi:hypothetical protein
MWFGAHLLVLLVIAVCLGLKASLLVAWANILAILSLLAAPFWFNPFSLDWQKNKVRQCAALLLLHLLSATVGPAAAPGAG